MDNATCTVETCDRHEKSGGLCAAHLQRVRRKGDVQAHIPLRGQQDTATELWCSRCEARKPRTDFYRNRTTKSGHDGVCKDCTNKRRADKSTHRAIVRKAYRERSRDRINEQKRRYYRKNAKADNEAGREWRRRNPERVKMQIKAQNNARAARMRDAAGECDPMQLVARWDYYGSKCWICGDVATDSDHVKPLARGGSNWPANIRPSCRRCNRSKSATWPFPLEVARGRTATDRQELAGVA